MRSVMIDARRETWGTFTEDRGWMCAVILCLDVQAKFRDVEATSWKGPDRLEKLTDEERAWIKRRKSAAKKTADDWMAE